MILRKLLKYTGSIKYEKSYKTNVTSFVTRSLCIMLDLKFCKTLITKKSCFMKFLHTQGFTKDIKLCVFLVKQQLFLRKQNTVDKCNINNIFLVQKCIIY